MDAPGGPQDTMPGAHHPLQKGSAVWWARRALYTALYSGPRQRKLIEEGHQEVLRRRETALREGEEYSLQAEKLGQTLDGALKDERIWIWEGMVVTPDRLAARDSGGAGLMHAYLAWLRNAILDIEGPWGVMSLALYSVTFHCPTIQPAPIPSHSLHSDPSRLGCW